MNAQDTRITRARTALLLDHPWFGSLALRLKIEASDAIDSMQTNGTILRYSPTWASERTDAELRGVIAHEVLHCALGHPYRMNGRTGKKWNQACDYAINPLLLADGFALPGAPLVSDEYKDMSAEQIYAALPADDDDDTPGGTSDQPGQIESPGEPGDGQDADSPADGESTMTAVDWQIAAEQAAMVAKRAGKMPGDVDRALGDSIQPRTDWRSLLRRFVEQTVPSDYSWTQPNRRYIAAGLYLPGVVKQNTPRLGVAIDTSGSVDQTLLDLFASELASIVQETRPVAVDVVYCDSDVQGFESFTADDPIELHAKGGGGTMFQPALDWFAAADEPPAAIIYLTDLESYEPSLTDPGIPVLWATAEHVRLTGQFGETIRLSAWE